MLLYIKYCKNTTDFFRYIHTPVQITYLQAVHIMHYFFINHRSYPTLPIHSTSQPINIDHLTNPKFTEQNKNANGKIKGVSSRNKTHILYIANNSVKKTDDKTDHGTKKLIHLATGCQWMIYNEKRGFEKTSPLPHPPPISNKKTDQKLFF